MDKQGGLPMKSNDLVSHLPEINKRLSLLDLIPAELRNLPEDIGFESLVDHGERLADTGEAFAGQYVVAMGSVLLAIKSTTEDGKWYEALGRLGVHPRKAQMMMKCARDFGDSPELIEGMGVKKMARLGSLPEEAIEELKLTGRVTLENGQSFTMTEFRRMSYREFNNEVLNYQNQLNEEKRARRDAELKLADNEREMEAAREQDRLREQALKEQLHGENKVLYGRYETEKTLREQYATENSNLRLQLAEKRDRDATEEEVLEAIENAKHWTNEVFLRANSIDLGPENSKMRAELLSFFQWAREMDTSWSIQIANQTEEGYQKHE